MKIGLMGHRKKLVMVIIIVVIIMTASLFVKEYIQFNQKGNDVMFRDGAFIRPLQATDYTFMWWAYGLRGASPEGQRILAVRTGKYGMAFDVEQASLTNLGAIRTSTPVKEALMEDNAVVLGMPEVSLSWEVTRDGNTYHHTGSPAREDTRIVESGRYVQRFYLANLSFVHDKESEIELQARLEVASLADFSTVIFEWEALEEMKDAQMEMKLDLLSSWTLAHSDSDANSPSFLRVEDVDGAGFMFSAVSNDPELNVSMEYADSQLVLRPSTAHWKTETKYQVALRLAPFTNQRKLEQLAFLEPLTNDQFKASAFHHKEQTFSDEVEVRYDPIRGWYEIDMPDQLADVGTNDAKRYERIRMSLSNPSTAVKRIPLLFNKDHGKMSITGLTPMIRDLDGNPSGLPVQISKNWHKRDETPLYSGTWFHGFTVMELAPQSTVDFEFTLAYAYWGGLPAASHAQLSLLGWGGNQLWEQVAIGSWGESITYDPDVGLNRAMINDVRPLLVAAPGVSSYNWTENVGGGDFLVRYDGKLGRQYLQRMRTFHKNYGPNLTEATYSGISGDGHIKVEITVSTPRTDDIHRTYHHVRYEVLEPVPIGRTAFYQLGAERYNNHQFAKMAYGNLEGLIEEWEPDDNNIGFERTSFPVNGDAPWFSLHEGMPGKLKDGAFQLPDGSAWANRGLVIRSWDAVIGGKNVPTPYVSSFRTQDAGVNSVNLELSAPPDEDMFLSGDYIDFTVELLIMPQSAEEYYGSNQALYHSLLTDGNTWKPILRQAKGNHFTVDVMKGEMVSRFPVKIKVNEKQEAEFELSSGLAYVPLTFTGLKQYRGVVLEQWQDDEWRQIDQSQTGNDYWQTYYDADQQIWEITFNVDMDSSYLEGVPARFRLYPKEQ